MKNTFFWVTVIALVLLSSCNDSLENADYYAFKSSERGKWGMVSPEGNILFEEEFKAQPTNVVGGVFFVPNSHGLWDIYEGDGKNTTTSSPDSYVYVLPFTEDVTLAMRENEHIIIIDKKGNVKSTLEKAGGEEIVGARPFHDGVSIISTMSGYGVVDINGKTIVKPKYMELSDYSDGVAVGVENKYKDAQDPSEIRIDILDTKGVVILSLKGSKYDKITYFKDGLMAVCKNNGGESRWGFINKQGEEVVKPSGENVNIKEWSEDCYIFSDGNQLGLKQVSNGEKLIRLKYADLVFATSNGSLLWARDEDNGKWSLVNKSGEKLTTDYYMNHLSFNGDYCPVQISEKEWGFINRSGEEQMIQADIYALGGKEYGQTIYSDFARMKSEMENVIDIVEDTTATFEYNEEMADYIETDTMPASYGEEPIAAYKKIVETFYAKSSKALPVLPSFSTRFSNVMKKCQGNAGYNGVKGYIRYCFWQNWYNCSDGECESYKTSNWSYNYTDATHVTVNVKLTSKLIQPDNISYPVFNDSFHLVKISGTWKIDDIIRNGKSLRTLFSNNFPTIP